MEFSEYQTLSAEQSRGEEDIPYKLIISFVPMTHKELMVAFAFDSYFYMLLYLFVGILSIAMIVIFMIYHRIIARARPVPKFKFCSYLKLTIPPAF